MTKTGLFALFIGLFCLACLPLSFSTRQTNYDQDEFSYYTASIQQISQHWPAVDLIKDSTSATSPGYSYFLAGVGKVTGFHLHLFRVITLGLSALVLLTLLGSLPARDPKLALLAVLPLAACNFFVKSSAWVVTDNPSLLLVCVTLLALRNAQRREVASRSAGLWAAGAVFVRQVSGWLLAPLGLCALLATFPKDAPSAPRLSRDSAMAWLQLLPPIAVLAWLVLTWHGLVPPVWQEMHASSIAPISIACALVSAFALGIFYLLSTESAGSLIALLFRPLTILAAGIGLAISLAGPSVEDKAIGHWGGYFWLIVRHTPAIGRHSLLVVVGAPLGAAVLAVLAQRLWSVCPPRTALVWIGSLAAWLASCAFNRVAFERYFDPMLLVFFIGWLALVLEAKPGSRLQAKWPLILLGLGQAAVTIATAYVPLWR